MVTVIFDSAKLQLMSEVLIRMLVLSLSLFLLSAYFRIEDAFDSTAEKA